METSKSKSSMQAFCSSHNEALLTAVFCLAACEAFLLYRNFRIPAAELEEITAPLFGSFIAVIFTALACIVMLAAYVLFGKRVRKDSHLVLATLCASSAPLLQLIVGHFFHQTWLILPCIALLSAGCACFLPELVKRLALAGVACTVRCNIACCFVLLVVAPASNFAPAEVFIAFLCVIPIAMLAYFRVSADAVEKTYNQKPLSQKAPKLLLLTILVGSVMEGVVGAVDLTKMATDMKFVVFTLAFIVSAALIYAVLLRSRGSYNNAIFRQCFPIMAVGFALFVLQGDLALNIGSLVFLVGRQMFMATILALVVYLIHYLDSDYYLLSLSVVIGAMLGSFIGLALFYFAGQVAAPAILPPAFIVFMLLFVLVASLFLMNASNLKTRWGMTAIDDSDEQVGLTFEQSCLILAEEWHLTKRECEIVVLMAKGKDKQAISEKLFISEGTVKVHARNIYQKLDIHSKQELITLVESTEDSIKE